MARPLSWSVHSDTLQLKKTRQGLLLTKFPNHKPFFIENGLLNTCLFSLCCMLVLIHVCLLCILNRSYSLKEWGKGLGILLSVNHRRPWEEIKQWGAQGRSIWSMCVVTFLRTLLRHHLEQPSVADFPVSRGVGQDHVQRCFPTSIM